MTVPVDLAELAAEAHASSMRLVDAVTVHAQRYADLVQRLNEHGPDSDDADGPEWEAFNDRSAITAYKAELHALAELAVALRDDDTGAVLSIVAMAD